jgi:hypothetical protein
LVNSTKKFDQGTATLIDTIKEVVNINTIDRNTQSLLIAQTNILHGATKKISEADSYLDRSENIVRSLLKRVFTNKLILFALIILLVIINLFLLYVKIKHKLLGF